MAASGLDFLKKAAFVFIALLFLLSACTGVPRAADFLPRQAFTLPLTAAVNGTEFRAVLTCRSFEALSLAFTAPEALRGFSAATEGDGYRLDVHGTADVLDAAMLRSDAPFRLLFDAVRAAVFTDRAAVTGEQADGGVAAALTVNGADVTVTFDAEGYLTGLFADGMDVVFGPPEQTPDDGI